MHTLASFYKSRQWQSLLRAIKEERAHDDGLVYCGHCGEPIVRAYDCIGHHTVCLTEANVNDYGVSLNPALIQLVHHRCHNKIHKKLGSVSRQVFIVYGAPLSGKSSWVNGVKNRGDLIVDIDSIWECVSGCGRYQKPPRLNSVVFDIYHRLLDDVGHRVGKWENAYVIGGYPLIAERERLCRSLGAREVLIDCSREECMERLRLCDDGRDFSEWEKYISDWFRKYTPPPR